MFDSILLFSFFLGGGGGGGGWLDRFSYLPLSMEYQSCVRMSMAHLQGQHEHCQRLSQRFPKAETGTQTGLHLKAVESCDSIKSASKDFFIYHNDLFK